MTSGTTFTFLKPPSVGAQAAIHIFSAPRADNVSGWERGLRKAAAQHGLKPLASRHVSS